MRLKVVTGAETATPANPRRPWLLTLFTISIALLTAVAALALSVVSGREPYANPWVVGSLLLLTVIGTHSEEVFGDETAINASIVVILAGAGIAYAGGPFWIPAACGLVAGLHWHHIRDRAVRKLFVNTSFTTLSALAAAEVARLVATDGPGVMAVAACGLATVMAYWLTDNVLVALVLTIVDGRPLREHARELVRSETEVIPFALLGFVCGYAVVTSGALFGVLGTAALLVLAETVVFRPARQSSVRRSAQWAVRIAPIAAAGAVLGTVDLGGIRHGGVLALVAVASFVGVGILDRLRASLGLSALVVCAVGAAVGIPGNRPLVVALVTGLGACGGFMVRRRHTPNRLIVLSAAASAVMASGGLVGVLEPGLSPSVAGALLVGLLGGLAALLAWHTTIGLTLALDRGRSILPTAGTVMRGEAGLILTGGLCGGGVGWIGTRFGPLGLFASLVLLLGVVGLALALSVRRDVESDEPDLADDELLDVLRSALLDVPASRLPE
jgi:hypothetical protein